MKELYISTYNSDLATTIKIESLKNIILDELFELFTVNLLIPVKQTPKDKVILNYTGFLFTSRQKQAFNEYGIDILPDKIIIDCSGKINNFDQIVQLKQQLKKQMTTLL